MLIFTKYPKRNTSSHKENSQKKDKLILTNITLCLGHQYDLIEKEKSAQITPASTASLSRWQEWNLDLLGATDHQP